MDYSIIYFRSAVFKCYLFIQFFVSSFLQFPNARIQSFQNLKIPKFLFFKNQDSKNKLSQRHVSKFHKTRHTRCSTHIKLLDSPARKNMCGNALVILLYFFGVLLLKIRDCRNPKVAKHVIN